MTRKIELSGEAADQITVLNLKEHRKYLKKGNWLHHQDVPSNAKLVEALNLIIKYFGAEP